MKRLIYLFLIAAIPISGFAESYQPAFSTAGFYPLSDSPRDVYCMNIAWRFHKGEQPKSPVDNSFDDSSWEVVSLPHGIEYLPVDASGCINYQGVVWYRKHFKPDTKLKGKKIFIHFEAIMGKSQVWVNGKAIKEHFGGFLPLIVDVSQHLNWGVDNVITVKADNSDDQSYPPGKSQQVLDFAYFGGIYRDCWLVAHNDIYITDANYEDEVAGGGLFVSYDKVSENSAEVELKTHIRNESNSDFVATVVYDLIQANGLKVKSVSNKIAVKKGQAAYSTRKMVVDKANLWSPDDPYLYHLDVRVKDAKGNVIDGYRKRIGIRSIEFKQSQGLWINGKPYGKIMGANRHQDFAVIGNALPNSLHWRDVKKLRDAGMQVIRSAHYPQDPAFMDACDELGMFVVVATPGWQFWGNDPIFAQRIYSNIRDMIRLNRDHPSVFFWEPVLNETDYPDEFAKNAAQICKQEYPYPYSESSCDDAALGDNYFSLLLRPTKNLKPDKTYFIREWGDNVDDWNSHNSNSRASREWSEEAMLIQSRHYESGYQWVYTQPSQVVGGCMWHPFDHQRGYHPDPFYGGIMDAFRQPKSSYYMFMSQRATAKSNLIAHNGPMVHIAHDMTPFSSTDVTVYSNCDEVQLTFLKDGKQYRYKKGLKKGGIPSPSIVFEDAFDIMECKKKSRMNLSQEVFLYAQGIIDGKVVATDRRSPALRADHIRLRLDDDGVNLVANGSDLVVVVAELVDKEGNVKRLNNSSLIFRVEGQGRIIGDAFNGTNPVKLCSGSAPILIQSTIKAGNIKVYASPLRDGIHTPIAGVLEFSSVPDSHPSIYCLDEASHISATTKENRTLSIENRAKRDESALKEVEKQQTKFGEGIND